MVQHSAQAHCHHHPSLAFPRRPSNFPTMWQVKLSWRCQQLGIPYTFEGQYRSDTSFCACSTFPRQIVGDWKFRCRPRLPCRYLPRYCQPILRPERKQNENVLRNKNIYQFLNSKSVPEANLTIFLISSCSLNFLEIFKLYHIIILENVQRAFREDVEIPNNHWTREDIPGCTMITYPRGTVEIPDYHWTSDVFRGAYYHHGSLSRRFFHHFTQEIHSAESF